MRSKKLQSSHKGIYSNREHHDPSPDITSSNVGHNVKYEHYEEREDKASVNCSVTSWKHLTLG